MEDKELEVTSRFPFKQRNLLIW